MQLGRSKSSKAKSGPPVQSDSNDSDDEKEVKFFAIKQTHKISEDMILKHPDCGKCVCVDYGDKRGSKNKDVWFPALIVSVLIDDISEEKEYTVRSFRDERYYKVNNKDAREFDINQIKVFANSSECSFELRNAIDRTINYLGEKSLPKNWTDSSNYKSQIKLLDDVEDSIDTNEDESNNSSSAPSRCDIQKNLNKKYEEEDEEDDDMDDDDDSDLEICEGDDEEDHRRRKEQNIERDVFVAQLYKFMDERGTPINSSPSVNGVELNLYKLHRVVTRLGGPTRVNNQNQWRQVFNKLGLASTNKEGLFNETSSAENRESEPELEDATTLPNSPVLQLQSLYKKYLHPFYDLNRKLGSTSCLSDFRRNISRPSRGERKREEERSRVNSTSSVSSTISTPTISNTRKSGIKSHGKSIGKNFIESSLGDNSSSVSCVPTTSTDICEGNNNKPPKSKTEEKSLYLKKNFIFNIIFIFLFLKNENLKRILIRIQMKLF